MTDEDKQALHLSVKTKAIRAAAERAGAHDEVAEFVPTRFELAIIAHHYAVEVFQWDLWSDLAATDCDMDSAEDDYNRLRSKKIMQALGGDELVEVPDLLRELWEERFSQLTQYNSCCVCGEPVPGSLMAGWVLLCPTNKVGHRNHMACPKCTDAAWNLDHYFRYYTNSPLIP